MTVRTRFAPSPTGNVHIGNVRVAIYNWLFARHHQGRFLLRLEDTDRERSTPEAVQTVFEAMRWLGLDHDGEPVYQSRTLDRHLAAAEMLLSKGLAYREDIGNTGKGECVVFRMPGRDIRFTDRVKGVLTKKAGDMKDLVIVRSNGTPVFHLANVVDDIDMGVTHVIRGDDHVENTFRHVPLFEALGAEAPVYAHLPMIVNAQGKPYSKRDGDAYVGDYRDHGYLPETLFNYLALLGWSPGDGREVMSRTEMIEAFDFHGVQSSPAQLDARKLEWMNQQHLLRIPTPDYRAQALAHLKASGVDLSAQPAGYAEAVTDLLRERVKFLRELPAASACFFRDDYPVEARAAAKTLGREGAREQLAALHQAPLSLPDFSPASAGMASATPLPASESRRTS
ncbi:MAG: glutamate--tRNA ligase family protein [Kiritimatiellia bacterium]